MLSPASRLDLALVIGFSNRALLRIGLSMASGFWVAMAAYAAETKPGVAGQRGPSGGLVGRGWPELGAAGGMLWR